MDETEIHTLYDRYMQEPIFEVTTYTRLDDGGVRWDNKYVVYPNGRIVGFPENSVVMNLAKAKLDVLFGVIIQLLRAQGNVHDTKTAADVIEGKG